MDKVNLWVSENKGKLIVALAGVAGIVVLFVPPYTIAGKIAAAILSAVGTQNAPAQP